ncbi:MAG: hypothetical protein EON59_09885, partial [Alphaproteobacteria bacterium]
YHNTRHAALSTPLPVPSPLARHRRGHRAFGYQHRLRTVGKLAEIGVHDTEPNVRNKISRGKFTAVFLVQCLQAIGASRIALEE